MQSKTVWSRLPSFGFFTSADLSRKDRELIHDKDEIQKLTTRIGGWDKYSWTWQYALPIVSSVTLTGASIWWISSGINDWLHPAFTRKGEVALAFGHTETVDKEHYDCDGTYLAYKHWGEFKPEWNCISTGGTCCELTNGINWQTLLRTAGFIGGWMACSGVNAYSRFRAESLTPVEVDPIERAAVAKWIQDNILDKFSVLSAEEQPTHPEKIESLIQLKNELLQADKVTRHMIYKIRGLLLEIVNDMQKTKNPFSAISVEEIFTSSDDDENGLLLASIN